MRVVSQEREGRLAVKSVFDGKHNGPAFQISFLATPGLTLPDGVRKPRFS